MSKAPYICFDKILPQDLRRQQQLRMSADGRVQAISPKRKQWVNGSTITIRFMEGTQAQQDLVRQVAPRWTEHANLHFEFTDDPRAKIRVSFDPDDGAWSYVGMDNLNIPLHAATLNLGWLDEGVILHEFGHMIGLGHEHQNPEGGIEWHEEAVLRDLSGPPNFWDEATVRHNVLRKYTADQVLGTDFDSDSIMLYAFPDEWTQNMGATHGNESLSDIDKSFVRSELMYPGKAAPEEKAVDLPVFAPTSAEISDGGEEDLYRFRVERDGEYVVQTSGATDVVLTLFGPDDPTNLVAEDDDSGEGTNSLIRANLGSGSYFARVRHFSQTRTGVYQIQVSAL